MYSLYIVTDLIRVARQQLCKHGPTCNNRGKGVFRVRGDVTTVRSGHVPCVFCMSVQLAPLDLLDSDHVTCVSCAACPFLGYINEQDS
jgi:hypothetical protein